MPTARRGLIGLPFLGLGDGMEEFSRMLSVKKSSLGIFFIIDASAGCCRVDNGLFSLCRDMAREVA
jgi:hypothetical protein